MALSLLCGGLGVAEATVHVVESGVTYEVLTTQEVKDGYGTKADVKANKYDIKDLQTTTTDQGQKIATNTADIANNKAAITTLDGKLSNLTTTVNGKADAANVYTKTEADAKLDLKANAMDVYTKADVNTELAKKADKTYVDTEVGKKADKATTLAGYGITDAYTKADVDNAVAGAVTTAGTNVDAKLADYAKTADVDTKLAGKADKATTLAGYGITDAYTKGDVNTKLDKKADQAALTQATDRITVNENAIAGLTTKTTDQQTAIDDLKKKTTQISYADGDGTRISGVTIKDGNIVGNGNSAITGLTNVATGSINGKSLAGTTVATEKDVSDAVKVETDARMAADTVLEGKINDEKVAREAEDTNLSNRIGTVAEDGTYIKKSATNNVSENLKVLDTQAKTNAEAIAKETADRRAAIGELAVNGNYIEKDKNVSDNLVKLDNQAKANADEIVKTNERTGGIKRNTEKTQTTIEGIVKVDNQGNVKDVKGLSAETITTGALTVTGKSDLKDNIILGTNAANTVTVNGTANFNAAVNMDKGLNVTNGETNLKKTTVDGDLKVTGTITTDKMIFGDKATNNYTEIDKGHITSKNDVLAGDATKKSSSMELDHSKLEVGVTDKDSNGHLTMTADQTSIKNSDLDGKNYSEIVADKDSVKTTVKDEKDNTTSTKSSATEIRNYAKDKDGNKTINVQTATQNKSWAKDKDGNESSIVQTGKDITNTAQNGTITNDANHIVNKANTMDTTVTGKATESYGELDTTVNRQATENFNGGLNTKVTGAENHTVTGKQTNTVEGGQENIISGGQTNTITGGQINNITGDQTTTITGNKKETVTENVTEDYKKDLTTTVGGNEIHDVKGTKTETVEGKLTENFKDGQETNVSGTQTINATDINRNASSGMIDTVDNAYGTNKETKVAGSTTTEVSIKGTDESGTYIRGATEARDYIIKGTLSNSETKTAEATSTEITDGTNKASTIQKVTDLAGSVTNGKETGVSGIHAKDNSVSIDSIVTDGNKSYSVINQKKGSIQSTVVDGTSSTVILQDKDNVTIASSKGMVGIVGKDIVNNAQDTITNTAGTKITDTAGDSTVTTENGKGTRFTKTGSTAYREGGPTDTNISGNTITTGKVTMDYADVMKDLGVRGNANITGKTTTGSLEVKGESKLTGDVTMENNATVGKNLTVNGITTTNTLKVTENAEIDGNATIKGDVTARSYKVGDKTYIDANGIHANGQKITDVADGSISEGSKDAVNGGQLYGVKRDLEHQVDKVGANAAAMANLRPMEFDPDSKWNIAAAIGNYGSETAAALGAFYRPNDDVMVNLSTAFGTGENMVGGGVSVRLGKGGNRLSREENNALKDQVNDLTARMDALLSVLNPNMSKDFPDVPENHWAYEAVSRLAGNDIVQGYPDGEFHGERTMTRYEMAEIIYNALSRGAEAEKELVEEFKPELQAMAASEKATAEKAEG